MKRKFRLKRFFAIIFIAMLYCFVMYNITLENRKRNISVQSESTSYYAIQFTEDTIVEDNCDTVPITENTVLITEDTVKITEDDNKDNWELILVNGKNRIPKNYEQEFTQLKNGKCIDSRIYPDLQDMFDDMRSVGIYPVVGEGYRTAEQQEQMMRDKINAYINEGYSEKDAEKLASQLVAKVGYSEHQLGLAVDINADENYSSNDEVYAWLSENAYRYGFILRYPADKTDITGIDYEPWHYRYVGKAAAKDIYLQGICLEEYLKKQ